MKTPRVLAHRLRLAEAVLLGIALLWSAALIVGAVTISTSSGEVCGSSALGDSNGTASCTSMSSTFFAGNGYHGLLLVAVPLLVTAVVGTILWLRNIERGPGLLAWTITGLLAAFTLLSMLTIGLFIVPVTGCLVGACVIRQDHKTAGRAATRQPHHRCS
jgi:hypothetical protein